jgi:hypothetical protein
MTDSTDTPQRVPTNYVKYIAGGLGVWLATLYIALIFSIDNTNLGTTNGLWKTPAVRSWELGTGRPEDSGGVFYFPVYGLLSRVIPNAIVSYGIHGDVLTFRKMALLNALFGGLASAVVFLLALRLTQSIGAALVVFLAHALSGFVVLNSLNSEDVIPAYAFFVSATALFFEYVFNRRVSFLIGSAAFASLTVFFHWTLMLPCLGAIAVGQVFLVAGRDRPVWHVAAFWVTFVGLILTAQLFLHFTNGSVWGWSPIEILYPAKAGPSGWLGFRWNKIVFAAIGTGNHFAGGYNFSDYHGAFGSPEILTKMTISWIYLAITLGACVVTLVRGRVTELRVYAAYGVALFLVGELEHLYSQPQDPQSQIEPMFVAVIGLSLLMRELSMTLRGMRRRLALIALTLVFVFNGISNIEAMYAGHGDDSRSIDAVRKLKELFPPADTIIVSQGFEGWNTWWYVEIFKGNSSEYLERNVPLFSAFTNNPGISPEAAAELMKQRIEAALAGGQRVVASALWTQENREFVNSLGTVIDNEGARVYDAALRNALRLGRMIDTPVGQFVELHSLQRARPERSRAILHSAIELDVR